MLAPDGLEEHVARNRLIRVQHEHGEQRSLLLPLRRHQSPPLDDLERSQDPEFHRLSAILARHYQRVTLALPAPITVPRMAPDRLTASEARIARLLASGYSDSEIASELALLLGASPSEAARLSPRSLELRPPRKQSDARVV